MMYTSALDSVREVLRDSEADALIVSKRGHVRKLTGFSGSNGMLVITQDAVTLFTDGRYTEQANRETTGVQINIVSADPLAAITADSIVKEASLVLIEGADISASGYVKMRSALGMNRVLVTTDLLEPALSKKAPSEVARIREAQRITDDVYSQLPGFICAGITEKELATRIVSAHLEAGAEKMSFEPIVAFGDNSALPHARPTDRQLKPGDPVLVDFGCVFDGYNSDMTRMLCFGEPSGQLRDIVDIVTQAKRRAIEAAVPGMSCKALDSVARDLIIERGYGDNFMHSLGHGVGLDVHEWPRISQRSKATLQSGDVITIEPGIYLPGRFGVRLEDLVVITENGCEVLTTSKTDLCIVELSQ